MYFNEDLNHLAIGFQPGLKIKHITVIQLLSHKYYKETGVWLLKRLFQSYTYSIFDAHISWAENILLKFLWNLNSDNREKLHLLVSSG